MDVSNEIPKYNELLWPTMVALRELGGSGSVGEIDEQVAGDLEWSEEVQSFVANEKHGPLVAYRLRWARTYLGKAGLIENSSRGVWALSDKGHAATEADMEGVPRTVRAMYRPSASADGDDAPLSEPEGDDDGGPWEERVIAAMRSMEPPAFERLAQRLLRESGFVSVKVTGRSGDGGIDGVGVLQMNLISFPVFFQCKRYAGSVPSRDVRDFRGAMAGRGDKGLFVSTGTFTSGAIQEANRDGAPPIDLIDGYRLAGILKQLQLGMKVEQVERVTVDADWFAAI